MHQHPSTRSDRSAGISGDPRAAQGEAATPRRVVRTGRMRRLVLVLLMLVSVTADVGCFVPIYSSSRDERARQLVFVSESLRHIPEIWERIWFLEMPDNATPYRVHGGVI